MCVYFSVYLLVCLSVLLCIAATNYVSYIIIMFSCSLKHVDGAEDPTDIEDIEISRTDTQSVVTSVQNLESGKAYILGEFLRASERTQGCALEQSLNKEEQKCIYPGDGVHEHNTCTECSHDASMRAMELGAGDDASVQMLLTATLRRLKQTEKRREENQNQSSLPFYDRELLIDANTAIEREAAQSNISSQEQESTASSLSGINDNHTNCQMEEVASKIVYMESENREKCLQDVHRQIFSSTTLAPSYRSFILPQSDCLPLAIASPSPLLPPPHSPQHPHAPSGYSFLPAQPSPLATQRLPSPQSGYLPHVPTHLETTTRQANLPPSSSHIAQSTSLLIENTSNNDPPPSGYVSNKMTTPTMGSHCSGSTGREGVQPLNHCFNIPVNTAWSMPTSRKIEEDFLGGRVITEDKNSISLSIDLKKEQGVSINGEEEVEQMGESKILSSASDSVPFDVPMNRSSLVSHSRDGQHIGLTPLLLIEGRPCSWASEGYCSMPPTLHDGINHAFRFSLTPSGGYQRPPTGYHGNTPKFYADIDSSLMDEVMIEYSN